MQTAIMSLTGSCCPVENVFLLMGAFASQTTFPSPAEPGTDDTCSAEATAPVSPPSASAWACLCPSCY